MRKIILTMQMSLDGVVSDVDRWMDMCDDIVQDSFALYDSLDMVIFGGRTYPSMAEYWQNAEAASESALERDFAAKLNRIEKIVVSRSPVEPVWRNSRPLLDANRTSFVEEVGKLRAGGEGGITVESGVGLWRLFLEHGLYDELWVIVHPVVAIEGDKLFDDNAAKRQKLRLIESKVYSNGAVGMLYGKL